MRNTVTSLLFPSTMRRTNLFKNYDDIFIKKTRTKYLPFHLLKNVKKYILKLRLKLNLVINYQKRIQHKCQVLCLFIDSDIKTAEHVFS